MIVVNPRHKNLTAHRATGTILRWGQQDTLDASDVVPGWKLKVADLFP